VGEAIQSQKGPRQGNNPNIGISFDRHIVSGKKFFHGYTNTTHKDKKCHVMLEIFSHFINL
jgi:hypothetical protein